MCGIAGMFGRADLATARAMLDTLVHRGPDDGHLVSGPDYVLGARRLSIVDLSGGRQPMSNEDGTIWAAQNGELYNFPTLKPLLQEKGHRFRTTCDTELLPHLYEEYGADLPKHLHGMFAISVWDTKKRQGLLARDRTGKKPLYYYHSGDVLYYASEIKSLLKVPGFERKINMEALHHFLSLKHVPNPLTIFEGIRMLPPGHTLLFKPGRPPEVRRYWRLDFAKAEANADLDENQAADRLIELFGQAVERRLMADVPIGFFLSGGIDSSLSTALAAERAPGQIKTFTLTYADSSTNEGKDLDRKWARFVAKKYKTEHHEETIAFDQFPENLRCILTHFDEPFAGVVSTYFLAQLIAKHVKVAVSGDGADELFGSYLSHRVAFPLSRFAQYQANPDPALIRPFEGQLDTLRDLAKFPGAEWRTRLFVMTEDEKRGVYSGDVAPQMAEFSTVDYWRETWSHLTAHDPLNKILEAEFVTQFPDQVLAFTDRLSMAHSLEVRTAFLDTDFIEFVASLPGRLKIKDGETKYILKKAALKYFPEEMVFRKKEGFLMPVAQWLTNDLESYVRETLAPERLAEHGLFDPARVAELVDRLYQPNCHYTHVNKVYALVVFQEWYDLYQR